MHLPVALFNYQRGGKQPDGSYDFTRLAAAFSIGIPTPALIVSLPGTFPRPESVTFGDFVR
ncbi:hypothetical protein [Allosalinactinospora lopnorensis]|uniref:hypothetical protein n=1 Tax=Allosalinactinospora lopnorensis TaxID=1352348 RepID=UPI000623FB43|nr:hypothetical protein [Allosalinactinospora lopnorensis]